MRTNDNLGRTNSGRPPVRPRAGDARGPVNDRSAPIYHPPAPRVDAASAETVLLQAVPAWSQPGPPRNDPPRADLRPTPPGEEITEAIAPPPPG